MTTRDPKLAYVLHQGVYCHVSSFTHPPPKARPPVFCPGCDEEVIPHIGRKYVHHAAHRQDATCALTGPETALHLNTKFHLYLQLSNARRLFIAQPCYGWWAPTVETEPGRYVVGEGRWRGEPLEYGVNLSN